MNYLVLPFTIIASLNADNSLYNDTYIGMNVMYNKQNLNAISNATIDPNFDFNSLSYKNDFEANIGKRLQFMESMSVSLEIEYMKFRSFGATQNDEKSNSEPVQQSLNFRCSNTSVIALNLKPRYKLTNSNIVISPTLGAMHWKSKVNSFHNVDDSTDSRLINTSWGLSYGLELEYQATSDVNFNMGIRQFKTDIPYGDNDIVNTEMTSIYAGFNYLF